MAIYCGTSGWVYDHWKGIFYPQDLSKSKWFDYFQKYFTSVELNASFYRIPSRSVVESWNKRTSDNFTFSVKVSRLISHVKRLHDCEKELDWFLSTFESLRLKSPVYLIQLPPNLHANFDLIKNFCKILPKEMNFAFEFRDPSWYELQDIYTLLNDLNHMMCIHDFFEMPVEKAKQVSAGVYIRFHGYKAKYDGSYPDDILDQWCQWLINEHKVKKNIFVYFNNDQGGFAVKNCLYIKNKLARNGIIL